MIDLKALKEQLRLLGHDLPDEQVVAILKEMNIDFDQTPGHKESLGTSASPGDTCGLPRTGSILDGFQGGQQRHPPTTLGDTAAQPETYEQRSYHYGYTNPAHDGAAALNHSTLASALPPRPRPSHGLNHASDRPTAARDEYSDDCYDHDSDDEGVEVEPDVSCRYCADEVSGNGGTGSHPGVTYARDEKLPLQRQGPIQSATANRCSLSQPGRGSSDVADRFGRVTLNETVTGSASRRPRVEREAGGKLSMRGTSATRASSTSQTQRPASAATVKDQHRKLQGTPAAMPKDRSPHVMAPNLHDTEEDDDAGGTHGGEEVLSDPDNDSQHDEEVLKDLGWLPPASAGAPGRGPQDPYAAWLSGRGHPVDARLADAVLAQGQLSPQASNRSCVSRATSRCSLGSKRGAKKVDRVQRYQQLQQEWSQNRFLKQAGGASRGTSRKPVNFHSHFAGLHAAEEAERQRLLRETRAKTKKELGAATEAPTAKRRDELRWQTRMRLLERT